MPVPVQKAFGTALRDVHFGDTPGIAKPLSGFGSGGVHELGEDYDRSTFRAISAVRFPRAVYVLHVFQKKSKRGINTPRQDIELVRRRLKLAQWHYEEWERVEETRG